MANLSRRLAKYGKSDERGRLTREQEERRRQYDTRGAEAEGVYGDYMKTFDASKGLNEWASGAYKDVAEGLGKTLERMSGQAVGAGRFNTGLFDADQGEVVRATQRDFSTELTGRALQAQGMQLGAMQDYGA